VSDFAKALKTQAKKPWVKKAELGEQAEGTRNALKAGNGNAAAGAKKLGFKKPGLAAAEKLGEKRMKPKRKR
jgi:hypothetical protein